MNMHKNTLWFIVAILCIYFSLVLCEETASQSQELQTKDSSDLLKSDTTELTEEGRTRRHRHHLYSLWGLHALAIAYVVKVKIVIVAFLVGTAIWFGARYFWPSKCNNEYYKEGSIILDHPPSFAHDHDHIPYSFDHGHDHFSDDHDHHFDSSSWSSSGPSNSFEPYSAYSGQHFDSSDSPPEATSPESQTFRRKRDVNGAEQAVEEDEDNDDSESEEEARQTAATEEQIGDFMFSFLGLDSTACRRRFICEMEFRSKTNPLTAMAFRVVGRSFFGKYTNDRNEFGRATEFEECAAVNSECVFIEGDNTEETAEEPTEEEHTEEVEEAANVEESENVEEPANVEESETNANVDDLKEEVPTEENSLESNNIEEKNIKNIKAELRRNSYRRRVRGDRHLKTE